MAKQIIYGEEARKALEAGIDKLSNNCGMRDRSGQPDWLWGGNHGFHSRTGSTYCAIHGSGGTH